MPDTRDTRSDERDDATARTQASGDASEGSSGAPSGRLWSLAAGACLVAAVALLFTAGIEAAFVAAVLGAVAWLWDQRNRIRAGIIEDERAEEGRDEPGGLDEDEGERGGDRRRSDEARGSG